MTEGRYRLTGYFYFITAALVFTMSAASAGDLELRCYPNPAKLDGAPLRVAFILQSAAEVTIEIYTIDGHRVKVIARGAETPAGLNSRNWNFTNGAGEKVIPGIYVAVVLAKTDNAGEKSEKFVFILE